MRLCAILKPFVFLIDISGYVKEALGMSKTQCKNLEAKASSKLLEIEVSEKFEVLARKLNKPVEWLATLACELFADDPPSEIIIVPPAHLAGKRKAARAA
jgi:hypothetical protein